MRSALLLACAMCLASCTANWAEMDPKRDLAGPAMTPAALSASTPRGADLCKTGNAEVVFTRAEEVFTFPVVVEAGAVVRVQSGGDPELDTVLHVYGPVSAQSAAPIGPVASDDDSGGDLKALIDGWVVAESGLYFVALGTWRGSGAGRAAVDLTLDGRSGCEASAPDWVWFHDGARVLSFDLETGTIARAPLAGSSLPHDDAAPSDRLAMEGVEGGVAVAAFAASRDGRHLAYCLRGQTGCALYVFDTASATERRIEGEWMDPEMSFRDPDATLFVLSQGGNAGGHAAFVDPLSGTRADLPGTTCEHAWAGDGTALVRVVRSGSCLDPQAGLERLRFTSTGLSVEALDAPWLPDRETVLDRAEGAAGLLLFETRPAGGAAGDTRVARCDLATLECEEVVTGGRLPPRSVCGDPVGEPRALSRDGRSWAWVGAASALTVVQDGVPVAATGASGPVRNVAVLDGTEGALFVEGSRLAHAGGSGSVAWSSASDPAPWDATEFALSRRQDRAIVTGCARHPHRVVDLASHGSFGPVDDGPVLLWQRSLRRALYLRETAEGGVDVLTGDPSTAGATPVLSWNQRGRLAIRSDRCPAGACRLPSECGAEPACAECGIEEDCGVGRWCGADGRCEACSPSDRLHCGDAGSAPGCTTCESGTHVCSTGTCQPIQNTWPQSGFDTRRTGYNPAVDIDATNLDQLFLKWGVATQSTVHPTPTVGDGRVYYDDYDGLLTVRSTFEGTLAWTATTGHNGRGTALDGTRVILVTYCIDVPCGQVRAFDTASGEVLWTWTPSDARPNDPAILDGVLYLSLQADAGEDRIQALSSEDGKPLWTSEHGGEHTAVTPSRVYASGDRTESLRVLDRATGALLWSGTGIGIGAAGPVVAEPWVYVRTVSGRVLAFGAAGCGADDCPPAWDVSIPGPDAAVPPAVAHGRMFIGAGSTFYAFDASGCGAGTCDPVWTAPTACDRFNTSPTVGASLVYAPCGNGDVYVYEATTGKELAHWEFETTGYPWRTPVVAAGKHLFVVPTFGFKVQMLSLP